MGRTPCCDKQLGLKKGPWTPEEDKVLVDYIQANGHGSWRSLPKLAGLQRCGKSCRLRWTNYLRPDIKRGPFTTEEQKSIIQLHGIVGNKWSTIAAQLAGRTDNEIKNYWNTHLKKRLLRMGIDPKSYAPPRASPLSSPPLTSASSSSAPAAATLSSTTSFTAARHMAQWESARLEAEARLSCDSLLFSPSSLSASASAATGSSAAAAIPASTNPDIKKEPVDVFLRMWNSDIGDAFRKQTDCTSNPKMIKEGDQEEEEEEGESSCCNTKQSSALTMSEANNNETEANAGVVASERREEVESNEVAVAAAAGEEETSDETYQFYLDLAAGDDLSLFQNQQMGMGMSCYSWFGNDLNEASLDNPFK